MIVFLLDDVIVSLGLALLKVLLLLLAMNKGTFLVHIKRKNGVGGNKNGRVRLKREVLGKNYLR